MIGIPIPVIVPPNSGGSGGSPGGCSSASNSGFVEVSLPWPFMYQTFEFLGINMEDYGLPSSSTTYTPRHRN